MNFLKLRNKLPINIILILTLSLFSCRNEIVGEYIGIDETKSDEIKLKLNHDNTFSMELYVNGNYRSKPQKTIAGVWKKEGSQLKLITQNDVITYEQTFENYSIAGKSFNVETYKFKTCKEEFFASNFNLKKDRNVEE
jgi:hypothetical protein